MQLAIYAGNIVRKDRRKRGEKEHPVGLPRDVQYSWRGMNTVRFHTYKFQFYREFTGIFPL